MTPNSSRKIGSSLVSSVLQEGSLQKISSNRRDLLIAAVLFVISVLLLFPNIGSRAVLPQGDEEMHIATIRESIQSGEILFPRFEGIMNLYKPPVLFWTGIASDLIFGMSLTAERLPSLFLFAGTGILIYFALRLFKAAPIYSAIIASSYLLTLGVFKFSRLVMMEALMTFLLTLSTFLLLVFFKKKNRSYLIGAAFVSGFACLVKGPLFQVYSGTLLAGWAFLHAFQFTADGEWSGKKRFFRMTLDQILFHAISLGVLALWGGILTSLSPAGSAFLKVFFFTENLGKFSNATTNQNELIILLGWVLYCLPFTPFLLETMSKSILKVAPSFGGMIGRTLIFSTVAISIIHELPNRKDYYYILPLIPLAFIGVGLYFSRSEQESALSGTLSRNFQFLVVVSIVLGLGKILLDFRSGQEAWVDLLWVGFANLVGAFWMIPERKTVLYKTSLTLLLGTGFMFYLQLILIPSVNLPDVPLSGRIQESKNLCVISENPWVALTFKNALPTAEVEHSLPGAQMNCMDGKRDVVVYRTKASLPNVYSPAQSWSIWKRDLGIKEILIHQDWYDRIQLYSSEAILSENSKSVNK
ncbi:ArnT family glycosyltransferase [Leptospira stimsonii]|uniref:Phospholipid carrier-dependent glycosyltransferase n=1 Tax=Leptospira stimsonii TaxID=2202203 RepID=A0ABY2N1M7_9LEPT|nr:phospholipid carrier-dependent glycosyltransferase [Leptospira stimsonii]TGK20572.1 phospholipid carrier-dependent glycosyltransferase [Leptospira stimsonii]TGM14361.1 phospholipid carrier-dependent glycosyltransferase [Leptospira stimsonii]